MAGKMTNAVIDPNAKPDLGPLVQSLVGTMTGNAAGLTPAVMQQAQNQVMPVTQVPGQQVPAVQMPNVPQIVQPQQAQTQQQQPQSTQDLLAALQTMRQGAGDIQRQMTDNQQQRQQQQSQGSQKHPVMQNIMDFISQLKGGGTQNAAADVASKVVETGTKAAAGANVTAASGSAAGQMAAMLPKLFALFGL